MTDPRLALSATDPGYDGVCASYSLLDTPAPVRAIRVTTVEDVQAAVRYAAAEGLRVGAFATGHAAGRLGRLDDALLVRTALAEPVSIDPVARTARIPAGRLWAEVAHAAEPFGLLALHGSSGTVGAVGYLLNGGLSFAGRLHGVGSGSVVAVEVVAADGEVHRVDAEHDPDLLWALRGGGAGLGVVTAVEARLYPVAAVLTGARFWTGEAALELLTAWRDWSADASPTITTAARVLRLPPLPGVPPVLTGGPVLGIDGAVIAETAADVEAMRAVGADLLDRLDEVATPVLDTWHEGGPTEILATHMDPPEPSPAWTAHDLLDSLPDTALAAIVEAGLAESPLLATELRQLGGAFAEPPSPGGIVDRVGEPFLLQGLAIAPAPEVVRAAEEHYTVLRGALAERITTRCMPTFLTAASDGRGVADDDALARLARVRERFDPEAVFAVFP